MRKVWTSSCLPGRDCESCPARVCPLRVDVTPRIAAAARQVRKFTAIKTAPFQYPPYSQQAYPSDRHRSVSSGVLSSGWVSRAAQDRHMALSVTVTRSPSN